MKEAMQGKIKFADNKSLTVGGPGRVVLRDSDDREVVIDEVLYVPVENKFTKSRPTAPKRICDENGWQLSQYLWSK